MGSRSHEGDDTHRKDGYVGVSVPDNVHSPDKHGIANGGLDEEWSRSVPCILYG